MISDNCNSDRMTYIRELQKYMNVSIYGKCGTLKCPENIDCRKYISEKYLLYFAFENSICNGYVTEKLFDTLKLNILPVVLSKAEYGYWIPKSGYINALDYESPQKLAKYLNALMENKEEYNKRFRWKQYLKEQEDKVDLGFLCEMCVKLNLEEMNNQIEKKQLNNLKQKFDRNENCMTLNHKSISFVKGGLSYGTFRSREHEIDNYGKKYYKLKNTTYFRTYSKYFRYNYYLDNTTKT